MVKTDYSYNQLGLLASVKTTDAKNNRLRDLSVTYSATKNINQVIDHTGTSLPSYMPGTGVDYSQTLQYDSLDRLLQASGPYGQQAYGYDAVGNLNFVSGQGGNRFNFDGDRLVSGDGLTAQYDGTGNLTRKVQGGITWDYGFDAQNRNPT